MTEIKGEVQNFHCSRGGYSKDYDFSCEECGIDLNDQRVFEERNPFFDHDNKFYCKDCVCHICLEGERTKYYDGFDKYLVRCSECKYTECKSCASTNEKSKLEICDTCSVCNECKGKNK